MVLEAYLAIKVITSKPAPLPALSTAVLEAPAPVRSEINLRAAALIDHVTPSWELNSLIKTNPAFQRDHQPTVSLHVTPGESHGLDASVRLSFKL